MIIVGLTGGIGSGKTTVAHFFEALGIPVYIADDEAKRLMLLPPLKAEIIELLGSKSYDKKGQLNRKYMATQIFNNAPLLEKLNALVHPRVHQDLQEWAKRQKSPYVVYETALLFESQSHQKFDYSILVTAPKAARIARLKKRDHSSEQEIQDRMQHQWPDERKIKLADWVICNQELSKTKTKVMAIHNFLLNL